MKRRDAFTLTELLVLVPISAMLGGLLLASLSGAQQTLQAAACLGNLRQWGLAFAMYANDYHDYVPYEGSGSPIGAGPTMVAWYDALPHYMNQMRLTDLYTSIPPRPPAPGIKSVFICPSAPAISNAPTASNPYFSYAQNRLMEGKFPSPPGQGLKTRSIAALPAQVILFSDGEDGSISFSYTDGHFLGQNTPRHNGGDNFLFVDGHAAWEPLAIYQRTSSQLASALNEWVTPQAVYWYPCKTCNKL